MGVRGDLRLEGMAVRKRWLTDEQKPAVMAAISRCLSSENERVAMSAVSNLIAMESQNQKDELSEASELLGKIIELAAELDIDLSIGESVEGKTDGTVKRVAVKQNKKRA